MRRYPSIRYTVPLIALVMLYVNLVVDSVVPVKSGKELGGRPFR